jgi:RNA polymerase sigma-70 factor (ECF subfamily)
VRRIDETHGPPDAELVERARSGDEVAFDQLVRRHHEVAWRVALAVLNDEDLASDAVQNGWIKVSRALPGFRGDAQFRTWLLSIVVNEARTLIRRRSRRREESLDPVHEVRDPARSPERDAILRDEAGRALELMRQLPEKQRLAVQLRIQEGLSFKEVGESIGSSEGAARVNYHHGIRRLREMMQT